MYHNFITKDNDRDIFSRKGVLMRLKNIALSFAFVFFCVVSVCASTPKQGLITAYDVYIPPADPATKGSIPEVILKAKFEREGILNINPDVKKEVLSFYIDGKFHSEAKTIEDGFAKVIFQPPERKNYVLTVKLEKSKKYKAKEESGLIYAIDPSKPTIIVDIDNTVSITKESSLIFNDFDKKSKPLKDAVKIVRELTDHYNLIFITAREDAFLQKTRSWMKAWDFPLLPIFYADYGQTPLSQLKFKTEAVAKVKRDIKNVFLGIGDKDHDAKAYLKNGLKAYIIREKGKVPEGAIMMRDWQEIRKELIKE